jgi:EAL domain-containing protein (putative c-di-GMP-specific phosphodiesterase class I)
MGNPLLSNAARNSLFSAIQFFLTERKKSYAHYRKVLVLEEIINKQTLSTFFQPILDLKNGKTIGYEVLNRPPSNIVFSNTEDFYDFIGKTDRVFQFECFIRNISLKRIVDCFDQVPNQKNGLIFLNIHPQVLLDPNYKIGETKQLLEEFGISPEQIVFELTEKQAVTDFVQFERILSHYRDQGFRIAVDDAGSGFNSLKTLVYLKPEFIKLDKSLIQDIDRVTVKQQLVSLVKNFASESNTCIIAEGIERVEEYNYLLHQGISLGQGYGLGKPNHELTPGTLPIQPLIQRMKWNA